MCGATVCTVDHLHFALTLAASFRRHHPELELHLLVVDGDGVEIPAPPGVVVLRGSDVGLFDDPYLALKLSAAELCCAAKPFLLAHLARRPRPTPGAVYLDADIRLFAPCERLVAELQRAPFVVFPHTVAPLPQPELWWERPSLGELAHAGVLNAGMFGSGPRRYRSPASSPNGGSLVCGLGAFQTGQTEQNSFNWVVAFADDVRVVRDTAYNVAYWNLHDRSLRCRWIGAGGRPGVHRRRPSTRRLPFQRLRPDHPVAAFRLRRPQPGSLRPRGDRAGRPLPRRARGATELTVGAPWLPLRPLPLGHPIDARMRNLFKEHETDLRREENPYSSAGGGPPTAGPSSARRTRTASLLPVLLTSIPRRTGRSPGGVSVPISTPADAALVRRRRRGRNRIPAALRCPPARGAARRRGAALLHARAAAPATFAGLGEPLGRDRQAFISPPRGSPQRRLAASIRSLDGEVAAVSLLHALRGVVEGRPDLHAAYPDLLDGDAAALATWLRLVGTRTEFATPAMVERFERAARGGALARIFSFVDRYPAIIAPWPLALVGVGKDGFARALLAALGGGVEFDLDDVVMYLWLMDEKPWAGVPLTLELRVNADREPSPLLPEGQEALLAPVLADVRFRRALDDHRRRHGPFHLGEAASIRGWTREPRGSVSIGRPSGDRVPRHRRPRCRMFGTRSAGVNLFGFFRSPIGLGTMSHGLALALRSEGVCVRENLLTNQTMDADLTAGDFVRRYDPSLDTNLFVSFPHLEGRLLDRCPRHQTATRHNVAYLAWEQREGNRLWAEAYADLDQVWALSSFAAGGLREALGARCHRGALRARPRRCRRTQARRDRGRPLSPWARGSRRLPPHLRRQLLDRAQEPRGRGQRFRAAPSDRTIGPSC